MDGWPFLESIRDMPGTDGSGPLPIAGNAPLSVAPGVQVTHLAFQVRLEPAAVLPLERPQVIDPALQFLALLDQRAHGLAVPLLGVPLQALGAGPARRW